MTMNPLYACGRKIYCESATALQMKEASCNNMTESVVKTGLKKSMGAKTWIEKITNHDFELHIIIIDSVTPRRNSSSYF